MVARKSRFVALVIHAISLHAYHGSYNVAEAQKPAVFQVATARSLQTGRDQLMALNAASSSENFLDRLFGTDCFTKAVASLEQECKDLQPESKSWLALRFAECQLLIHGESMYPCASDQPLKACLDGLTDRQWQLYVEFLTHTESVCLYLQNRAFEKHTAFMLNQLSIGAAKAEEQLGNIGSTSSKILATTQLVHEMAADAGQSLERIHRGQEEAALATETAFKGVTARFSRVHRQQQQSLDMQRMAAAHQRDLAKGQKALVSRLRAGHLVLHRLLKEVESRAQQVAAMQLAASDKQHALATDLQALTTSSSQLRAVLTSIQGYQQRLEGLFLTLAGNRTGAGDILTYSAFLIGGWVIAGLFGDAGRRRALLVMVVAASFLTEKLILQYLCPYLELQPGSTKLLLGVPALPWIGRLTYQIDVQWVVRCSWTIVLAIQTFWKRRHVQEDVDAVSRVVEALETDARQREDALRRLALEHNLSILRRIDQLERTLVYGACTTYTVHPGQRPEQLEFHPQAQQVSFPLDTSEAPVLQEPPHNTRAHNVNETGRTSLQIQTPQQADRHGRTIGTPKVAAMEAGIVTRRATSLAGSKRKVDPSEKQPASRKQRAPSQR